MKWFKAKSLQNKVQTNEIVVQDNKSAERKMTNVNLKKFLDAYCDVENKGYIQKVKKKEKFCQRTQYCPIW